TRFSRDWSSDVCSSDLDIDPALPEELREVGSLLHLADRKRTVSPAGSAVQGIEGGMWRLTAALADAVRAAGGRIVTSAAAERLKIGRASCRESEWVSGG